jgi:uncharacterized protein (TIGR02145 family)
MSYFTANNKYLTANEKYLTGARPLDVSVPYFGLLYNWYAVDTSILAPIGWHVPSASEFTVLVDYLGGESSAGGKLKANVSSWRLPNIDATNISGFTALCANLRYPWDVYSLITGAFSNQVESQVYPPDSEEGEITTFWSCTKDFEGYVFVMTLISNSYEATIATSSISLDKTANPGVSIRCIRDNSVGWVSSETITDYDGNTYNTVQIGTQIWTKQNLAVTRYNEGTIIPEVTDPSLWYDISTGALCAYRNDWSYVFV